MCKKAKTLTGPAHLNPSPFLCCDAAFSAVGSLVVLLGFLLAYVVHRWGGDVPRTPVGLYTLSLDNLSVLGWTRDRAGADNAPASLIFAISLCAAGLVSMHFWWWRAQLVSSCAWRQIATVCGLLTGGFLFAVGLLPEDLYPREHNLMIFPPVLFGALAILGCTLEPVPVDQKATGRNLVRATMVVLFVMSVALKLAEVMNVIPRKPALPLMQKGLILFLALWILGQSLHTWWRSRANRMSAGGCSRRSACLMLGGGILLFFGFLGQAIYLSPDRGAGAFALGHIYLSSLGRVTAISGADNSLTRLWFSAAVLMVAFSLVPFWWVRAQLLGRSARLSRLVFLLGLGLSLGLVAGVLTPQDVYYLPHKWVTRFAGACGLLAVAMVTMYGPQGRGARHLRHLWLGGCAALTVVSLLTYAGVLLLGWPDCPAFSILQGLAILLLTAWLCVEIATM